MIAARSDDHRKGNQEMQKGIRRESVVVKKGEFGVGVCIKHIVRGVRRWSWH